MHLANGRFGPVPRPGTARSALLLLALVLALALPGTAAADTPHVVEAGDTLGQIAMFHGLTAEELTLHNNLMYPDYIYAGQVIIVPGWTWTTADEGGPAEVVAAEPEADCSEVVHVVSSGETMGGIAIRYGVTVAELASANGISNPSQISVGQVLRIAGAACAEPLVLNAPFVSITWEPVSPHQGDTVRLVVETDTPISSLRGLLGEVPIRFLSAGTRHVAYVGIPAMAQPGFRQAELYVDGVAAQVLAIPVLPWTFTVERLILTEETTQLLEPEVVAWENNVLASVCGEFTEEEYWGGSLAMPLDGNPPVISDFGTQRAYNDGPVSSYHGGTDFPAAEGLPVMSSAPGRVAWADALKVRGNAVILDHGAGVFTMYCHLSAIEVQTGDVVGAGDVVGLVGNTGLSTGPHLHWEMRVQGERVDPMRLVSW